MRKINKVILSFVMILFLVLQMIPKSAWAETSAEDTTNIVVSVFTEIKEDDGKSPKLSYYTGEDIQGFAEVNISGNETVIKNPTTKITIPKEKLDWKPTFSRSGTAQNWEVTEDETNWYATYTFDQLVGGQSVAVPFIFKWQQFITPNGFKTPVKYEVIDKTGAVVASTTTNFIAKTYPLEPFKRIGPRNGSITGDSDMAGTFPTRKTIDGHQVVVGDIKIIEGDDPTMTKANEDAPFVYFRIGVQAPAKTKYGKYIPESVKIIDKLPAGAIMAGEPDADGYYTYNSNKWKYDATTHTATYVGSLSKSQSEDGEAVIKLNFPNQPYATVHENKASVMLNPDTENEEQLAQQSEYVKWDAITEAPEGGTLFMKSPEDGETYMFSSKTDSLAKIPHFTVRVENENNEVVGSNGLYASSMVKEITDFGLDNRLYYKYVFLSEDTDTDTRAKLQEKGYQIIAVKKDGSEVVLAENKQVGEKVDINDVNSDITKIIIRINEPIEVANGMLKFQFDTPVKPEIWEKWRQNPGFEGEGGMKTPERFENKANVTYYDSQDSKKTMQTSEELSAYITYEAEEMKISSSNGRDYTVVYSDNNAVSMYGRALLGGNLAPITPENPASNYVIHNVKHITLLPVGIDYVPGSGKKTLKENNKKEKIEPEIIKNYKNTGKTAVIFNLGDIQRTNSTYTDYVDVDFDVDVSIYTKEGNNLVEHFITWDKADAVGDPTQYSYNKKDYIDTLDLDNNGNTTETFLRSTNNINFIPPREVLIKKYVSTDGNNWLFDGAVQELGKDVYYKLNLLNNSLRPLITAHILDVLPYVNDHSIAPNSEDQYLPRESVFAVKLTQFLEDIAENTKTLEKWEVLYSTTVQGATLAQTRDAQFVPKDQISNIEDVKLVKIQLKAGQQLKEKEAVNFIMKGKMPTDTSLNVNDSAKNSAAVSTNEFDYLEGNKVSITLAKYTVEGTVFADIDKDSLLTNKDGGLAGYTLQLMNEDGTAYLDESNQPLITTSDASGHYHFNLYKQGQYYVKITKKGTEEFTTINSDKSQSGNDATQDSNNASEGKSSVFAVSPLKLQAEENFGFINLKGSITIKKVNPNLKPIAGVEFKISKDDVEIARGTTDEKGELLFTNLDFGEYDIVEISTLPAYKLDENVYKIEITKNNSVVEKSIMNQFKDGRISITKIDAEDSSKLEGVTFELRDGDTLIASKTTNEEGIAVFEDVPHGTYSLVETQAKDGYVLNTAPVAVVVSEDEVDVSKTISNTKIKGSLKVTKIDAEDSSKLAGVTFELRDGDSVVASKETNAEGIALFENVPYGTYSLVETQAKAGYVSNTTPQEVVITTNNEIVVKEITNAKIKGKVRVLKADELDGTPLAGVTFELRKDGTKVQEGITNANGELLFNDVAYGTYEIVETKAKAGYVLNETPKTVDVHENEVTVTKEFTNNRIEGSLKVIKTDAEDHSKLEGVRFDLQKDGETIISKATNAEGIIVFENLEYGTYTLVEKYAKDGYVLNAEPQEVIISANGVEVTKEITNTKIKGSIKVIKIDAEDSSKLEGVQFELRKDGEVVQTQTTDTNGEIVFKDVVFGTYELVETKAKTGYELNSEAQEVVIRENKEMVEKVITNKKEPVKPEEPKPNVPEEPKKEDPKPNVPAQPKKENPKPIKPIENGKPKENAKLKEKVETNDNTSMGTMMLLFISSALFSSALFMYRRKR